MPNRPDFTGVWAADFKNSRLQIEAPDQSEFAVEHRDPAFRLIRTHRAKGLEDIFSLDLTTDGRETVVHKGDLEIRCTCEWQGRDLLFRSVIHKGPITAENVVRYALSRDGRTITADERFQGPPKDYHNIWVLTKSNG